MIWRVTLILAFMFVSEAYAQSTQPKVVRWSIKGTSVAEVISMDEQGVTLRYAREDLPTIVPWYDFRSVINSDPIGNEWESVNEDAWRAHARLIRGDFSGAAQIYDQLAEPYLWKVGPQSADVSIGLARTRLDRGDRVEAVLPFLSWNVALGSNSFETVDPVDGFDVQYGILIDLPPVFIGDDFDADLEAIPKGQVNSQRAKVLYAIYAIAHNKDARRNEKAKKELVTLNDLIREQGRRDTGLALFAEMLSAMHHPDLQKRNASRGALGRRVRTSSGTWIEVWARLAIGTSLITEKDTQSNELGAIELIHIIVRLTDVSPALAEFASQIVNEYLIETNRTQWGQDLMLHVREGSMSTVSMNEKESAVHE